MKTKWVEKLAATAFCAAVAFMGMSCEKKSAEETVHPGAVSIQVTERDSSVPEQDNLLRFNPENGIICVLFGYGFNGEDFLSDIIPLLKRRYGLEEEGGIILPIVFTENPSDDMFSISKISSIYDIIDERNVKGIILLGAPEGTYKHLAKLRKVWDEKPPYAIFSLMPQDDALGEEFNCDFVLEYERNAGPEEEEVEVKTIDKTAEQIVLRAIRYMEDLPDDRDFLFYASQAKTDESESGETSKKPYRNSIFSDSDLHSHVQSIVGEKKVRRYVDGETGIQSINHFVIEQDK